MPIMMIVVHPLRDVGSTPVAMGRTGASMTGAEPITEDTAESVTSTLVTLRVLLNPIDAGRVAVAATFTAGAWLVIVARTVLSIVDANDNPMPGIVVEATALLSAEAYCEAVIVVLRVGNTTLYVCDPSPDVTMIGTVTEDIYIAYEAISNNEHHEYQN